MMTKCPACGSTEIMTDLGVFRDFHQPYPQSFVWLVPPKGTKGNDLTSDCTADVCGSCGHMELYIKSAPQLLEAYKKGYVSQKSA